MLITEKNRIALAVAVAIEQPPEPMNRFIRARVLFPDLGARPVLVEIGFARYPGEKSIVKPDATDEELSLPEGLPITL